MRKVQRPFLFGSTYGVKLPVWKCYTSYKDEDMVYSPNKYWETKGIKERNRLCKNRAQMANDKGIKKTFKPTPLLLVI